MSLNSVVGNIYTSQWEAERLQPGDILIHFHDVFWGVTMEGEQANEDEGENEDGSEDEDDIINGCHALDIDIPGIESSIWVRAEYIRIFDHIKKLYDSVVDQERKDQKSSCVILTGQPGIGELNC